MKKREMNRLVKMAIDYGREHYTYVECPKEKYGDFATFNGYELDNEKQQWLVAKKWWNDNAENFIPGLSDDDDDAINDFQTIETMIWKSFPNRNSFRGPFEIR